MNAPDVVNITNTENILHVIATNKSYGSKKALNNINFSIHPGEFIVLLGLNGAGKTTLFQLLTGLFSADEGSIEINGYNIRNTAVPALAGIGVVFQQPTLDLDLTVKANLQFHCRLHGISSDVAETRIDTELQRIGLQDSRLQPVRNLSGGNRRKVELARALLHEPHILLMDEATVGLDPASRHSLVNYVHQLCRTRNVAVLWATHLVDEANEADRIFILHKGQLLATGTPEELLQSTLSNDLQTAFLGLTANTHINSQIN
jgi:ABC-2 type transport system ATP-binding protein